MCSISSHHSNWVYSSGWLSNLTFDQNEKLGIPFTLWQAGRYKSQPSQQGFFPRQWIVAVSQSSAQAIVWESFRFLKPVWAFFFFFTTALKPEKRENLWYSSLWGVKMFLLKSCIFSALLLVGLHLLMVLLFIFHQHWKLQIRASSSYFMHLHTHIW